MADEGGVLDELRAAILAGEFVAGQRLVEVDLCERFGCGRFAVRAAIPVLASEGLVDVQRHRGARVRIIPLAEAIEITEVRRLLEGLIAARAAERAARAEVAELRQVIREMREAVSTAELMRYSDANARLHGLIRRIGAHQTATGILSACAPRWSATSSRSRWCRAGPRCPWPSTSASSRPSPPGIRSRPRRPCWTTSPA
jgi:Transcriptional regulators